MIEIIDWLMEMRRRSDLRDVSVASAVADGFVEAIETWRDCEIGETRVAGVERASIECARLFDVIAEMSSALPDSERLALSLSRAAMLEAVNYGNISIFSKVGESAAEPPIKRMDSFVRQMDKIANDRFPTLPSAAKYLLSGIWNSAKVLAHFRSGKADQLTLERWASIVRRIEVLCKRVPAEESFIEEAAGAYNNLADSIASID